MGIAKLLPTYAGFLMEAEIGQLSNLLESPARPYAAIVGGAKVSGKLSVLDNLVTKYPGLQPRLFLNGQVRQFVNLYLNDEDIRYLDNLETAVKDGDELAIIPAVAGG